MNSYTYMIVHKCEPYMMYYIGFRKSKNKDVYKDNYWGSSETLKKEIEKNGLENFQKIILKQFENHKDALKHEVELHEKFDVAANPLFYNKAKATSTGFNRAGCAHSDETKLKIGIKSKGRKASDETRKKMSDAKKGNSNGKDKKRSDETKQNMSIAQQNRSDEHKQKIALKNTGQKRTDETRQKMSIAQKGKKKSDETKQNMSIATKERHRKRKQQKINKQKENE